MLADVSLKYLDVGSCNHKYSHVARCILLTATIMWSADRFAFNLRTFISDLIGKRKKDGEKYPPSLLLT